MSKNISYSFNQKLFLHPMKTSYTFFIPGDLSESMQYITDQCDFHQRKTLSSLMGGVFQHDRKNSEIRFLKVINRGVFGLPA